MNLVIRVSNVGQELKVTSTVGDDVTVKTYAFNNLVLSPKATE